MRLILSFLLFILSTSVFGQKQREVTFDFTNPSYLGLPTEDNNALGQESYTQGKVKMTFSAGDLFLGVRYIRLNGDYFLQMNRGSRLFLTGVEDAVLTNVVFTLEQFGDLSVVDQTIGSWDSEKGVWIGKGSDNISEMAFKNNGEQTLIKAIKVTYSEPINVLTPSYNSSQLSVLSFSSLSLNFNSNITKVGTKALSIAGNNKTYPLGVEISGSTVKLSTSEAITADGTYTISIPAGYFQDAEGYRNKALTYTIVVSTPKNTLNYVSVDPSEGEIDKLTSPIKLTFGENLQKFSAKAMMYKDGEEFAPVTMERSSENGEVVELSFDIPQGISDMGIYTIEVPEKTIYNLLDKIYNPAFTLTYKVGYKPESTTMKKAKALLRMTGAGYPAANSASRTALAALTTAEEIPADEDLQTAITAYYNETDIELPTVGKWYNISNIGTDKTPLYINVKNGEVGVTASKSEATAFEVVEPMLFKTADGKYLFTASVEDNADNKTITLAKMAVAGVDAETLFGSFSINGYYKTNKSGEIKNAYASVDRTGKTISTDDDDTAPVFNDNYSGAFTFAETTEPSAEPTAIDMQCTVSPATITDDNSILTLTFTDVKTISLNANAEVKLCTDSGTEIQSLTLRPNDDKGNVLTVNVGNLQDAKYKITIPAGCLSYTENGTKFVNKEMQVTFEVKKGNVTPDPTPDPKPSTEFNSDYSGFLYYPRASKIKDVDLNDFTIANSHYNYPEKPQGLMVDETKEVILKNDFSDRVIRRGHFKKVASIPTDPNSPEAYQIVFDTPITEDELPADIYIFVIPEATFGDYNFGKYLKDPSSVEASSCHVNKEIKFPFTVDNKATDIDSISTDGDSEKTIYTLQGVRVTEMTQPGIYIVNGRKVVVRK